MIRKKMEGDKKKGGFCDIHYTTFIKEIIRRQKMITEQLCADTDDI